MINSGPTLADLGEDALIVRLTTGLQVNEEQVVLGPGDDCAVVKGLSKGWWQLLKTDAVVEGVHFLRDDQTAAEQVGWKALARVVSDIGAMGGEPMQALVTLMAPKTCPVKYLDGLYAGLNRCAERFGVSVVGGEVTSGPLVMLSVSLTGRVRPRHCVQRGGASLGDEIFVTGRLGGSLRGHHLSFVPRMEEGCWLAQNQFVHAMMDLSDGLAKDLPRMAAASGGLEWEIFEDQLPLNEGCTVQNGIGDGEDYELLLAVPKRKVKRLLTAWQERFPQVLLSHIGRFKKVEETLKSGSQKPLEKMSGGWDHFKNNPQ